MNEKDLKKKIAEYNEQLKDIEHAETMVKSQIDGEREYLHTDFEKGRSKDKFKARKMSTLSQEPLKSELEKRYQQAETELKEIQTEIDNHKSKSTELKSRITKIKNDFEQTPDDQRFESWARLSEEIKPLSETIIESESAISALEMRKFAAEQDKEMAAISLEAYKQKLHEKPIEEDPRLKAVFNEKDTLIAKLKKAEAKLKK